ncbi:MAG: serine/threonine-protein kinase [Fuerstiella sp.]
MKCHDGRLQVLLSADEDSVEFQSAAEHVEFCQPCQQRLAELSGDETLLQEVRDTLCVEEKADGYKRHASSSVVISIEHSHDDDDFGTECEPVSLDFLAPPSHPEMLGRIGRYEIERMIGSGGMGVVLKGFDTELHRVVAIKVLKPHLAHSGAARRRFAREAKSAAAVVHEHVIPIHDVWTEDETPYLVMQYVPGHSLQARVDQRGPLDAREVLRIARQAASGLSAAHAQGVVHRDVKPANILMEESVDRVLISDFGLARTVDDATLTRTGVVAGTPHYMSPEQATGQPIDQRSDLFSLGSVMYFMCTGRPPFRAEQALAILNRICNDEHRPVEQVNSDVPPEVADVIDRLLAKKPADRFRDAEEVEHRLESILTQLQSGRQSQRLWISRLWRRQRHTIRMGFVAFAAVACCVAAGAALMRWNMDPSLSTNESTDVRSTFASDPSGMAGKPGAVVDSLAAEASASSSLILLPPDTFRADLNTVGWSLARMESDWTESSDPILSDEPEWQNWSRGIGEVERLIDSIEFVPPASNQ